MSRALILGLLVGCSGGEEPEDTAVEPEYEGTFVVASFTEGIDTCEPDTPADWVGSHARISSGNFFGVRTVEVAACTSPTDCDEEGFSEYFLEPVSATEAAGDVVGWSQSGDACSITWTRTELTMDGGDVTIRQRFETHDDPIPGADLDECEAAAEAYSGPVSCSRSETLVLTPI